MSTTEQKALAALRQIHECLHDHGAGKYRGPVSTKQREDAFGNVDMLESEVRRLSAFEVEATARLASNADAMDKATAQIANLRNHIHTCGPNCTKAGCRNRQLSDRLGHWESAIGAVMQPDLKDWHDNDAAEWPDIAAGIITTLREQRDEEVELSGQLATQLATQKGELATLRAQVEALTKPKEPVAWLYHDAPTLEDCLDNERLGFPVNSVLLTIRRRAGMRNETPLYTHPAPSPLTRPAVPEGYKLVPVEPTPEMGWAYLDAARLHAANGAEDTMRFSWGGYRAMIAAAPQPEATIKESSRVEAQPTEAAQPITREQANALWNLCLKKYKRPDEFDLITEFLAAQPKGGTPT